MVGRAKERERRARHFVRLLKSTRSIGDDYDSTTK